MAGARFDANEVRFVARLRRLREAKIDVPYPTRRLEITNMPLPGGQPAAGSQTMIAT